jgi:hypothetical protein
VINGVEEVGEHGNGNCEVGTPENSGLVNFLHAGISGGESAVFGALKICVNVSAALLLAGGKGNKSCHREKYRY